MKVNSMASAGISIWFLDTTFTHQHATIALTHKQTSKRKFGGFETSQQLETNDENKISFLLNP